jgi:[acyl-carrier-protein] S-malonyltransferase
MARVAICFPGQGSQSNMMGFDLYNKSDDYRMMLDKVFLLIPELKDIIFSEDDNRINQTRYSQPAIFSNQVAIYNLIKDKLENDVVFCGFSLGEYSAFACSGLFDYENGLDIVNARALAMDSLADSGIMYAVIGVEKDELISIVDQVNKEFNTKIEIANSNTQKQQVIAGDEYDFELVMDALKESNIRKIIKLKVSGAFHTSRFTPIAEEFCDKIKDVELAKFNSKVYSNIDGKVIEEKDMLTYFKNHMVQGVDFYQEIVNMLADGVETFIEIGEVSVLSSMIKSVNREVKLIHIKSMEDIQNLEVL